MPGADDLNSETQDLTQLAGAYLMAGREAEGMAGFSALVAWNKSPEAAGLVGSALYLAKKYTEALPYLETGMRDADFRRNNGMKLMNSYLEAGNTEKALALWRDNRNQREFREIYQLLDQDRYRPVARELLEFRIQDNPADLAAYGRLGRMLLRAGDAAGTRELFNKALAALPPALADQVATTYGTLLASEGQLPALLEVPPGDDPLLVRALAEGYQHLTPAQRSEALRDKVLALPLNDGGALSGLASFFQGIEDKATATTLWQRALALETLDDAERVSILRQLAEAGALADARDQVLAILKQNPALMRGNPELMAFVARSGDPEALAQAMVALRDRMPEGDSVVFFEKLAACPEGDVADLSPLLAFAETASLEEWQWRHLARICKEAGNKEAEATMLEHIAGGGFGTSNRDRALAEICVIDAEAGRPVEAFARYQAISPGYGDREGLMESIAKSTAADHIPALQAAVDEAAAVRPGNLLVPDWMGEVAQLAESAGTPIDLAAWVAAAALSPAQRAEALQWARLYEGWQVSPRTSVEDIETHMEEAQTKTALTPEGAPIDLTGWLSIDPKQSLGLVNLGPVLFPRDGDFEQAGALAYKAIDSPSGGPTDLAFASNIGNAQVWINGVLVRGNFNRNAVRPGLERFRVDLKAGVNHVVVKSVNNNKRWLFCLGTMEPRPPLSVTAPPPAAPALAAAG
jgi:tetratricopeptide (TPR) repeat protein